MIIHHPSNSPLGKIWRRPPSREAILSGLSKILIPYIDANV